MRSLFRTLLPLAAVFAFSATAEAKCYHKAGDWSETLRDTNYGSTLIWLHRGRSATLYVRHVGSGIPEVVACKNDTDMDSCLDLRLRRNKMILGGVTYVAGCRK